MMNEDKQFLEMLAQHFDERLRDAAGNEAAYLVALDEKATAICQTDTADGAALRAIEERIAQLQIRIREIAEARSTGEPLRGMLKEIIDGLIEAYNRYTAYTFVRTGHSFYRGMLRWLDYVQDCAHRTQAQMRRFEAELADLQLPFSAEVPDYTPPRSRSYVRVGFFVLASKAMDFLQDSIRRTQEVDADVSAMLERLAEMDRNTQTELEALLSRRRELIERACIFQSGD